MDISNIHFHDTVIHRVIEDASAKTLTMEVCYPVDWEHDVYEPRLLIFDDFHHYHVEEWELYGDEPTILDVKIVGEEGRWTRLRLETTAGYRELSCDAVRLAECDPASQ